MIKDKKTIQIARGDSVMSQAPFIISASRATDIPAFYADWFIERLKQGYVKWKNPFNGVPLYVSFEQTRLIFFWSKNKKPMLQHLDFLDKQNEYSYHAVVLIQIVVPTQMLWLIKK